MRKERSELSLRIIFAAVMVAAYLSLLFLQISGVEFLEFLSSACFIVIVITALVELAMINSKAINGQLPAVYFFSIYIIPLVLLMQLAPGLVLLYLFLIGNVFAIWFGRDQLELVHRYQRVLFPSLFIVAGLLSLVDLIIIQKEIVLIIWLSAAVFIADSVAYFFGKKFGETRLSPAISPNKTQAGLSAGIFFSAFIMSYLAELAGIMVFAQAFILLVIALFFAASGDLIESYLKRLASVKDSSKLIPGHGGLLDRFDALIGAAPILVLYTLIFS